MDADLLVKCQSLFSESFGGEVDISDELEFFNECSHSAWFVAMRANEPIGFIRQFAINDSQCRGELYVKGQNESVADMLVEKFAHSFAPEHETSVSFVFGHKEEHLISACKKIGLAEAEETFFSYVYPPTKKAPKLDSGVRLATVDEASDVKSILSSLVNRPLQHLISTVKEGRLFVLSSDDDVVAAAECSLNDERVEVITISVKESCLCGGFGTRLLQGIVAKCRANHPDTVIHAVCRAENIAAQRMNDRAGFDRDPDNDETWLFSQFPILD